MNINIAQNTQISYTGHYTAIQQANAKLLDELGKNVSNAAYQSGIPKIMVLKLMEKTDISDKERLADSLIQQFKGIFKLISCVKDVQIIQETLNVPQTLAQRLVKRHEKVLKEQQMINAYLSENISIHKFSERVGKSPSFVGEILAKWGVPNSLTRAHVVMEDGFKKYMKLTDIADLAGFKAGSVSRYRKVLGLAGKRESDKAERNPEIVKRLIAGESRKALAKEYGLVRGTIDRIAQENDVWRKKIQQRDVAVVEKIKAGIQYKDIAEEFGISADTVQRIAKKYNCKRRKS